MNCPVCKQEMTLIGSEEYAAYILYIYECKNEDCLVTSQYEIEPKDEL